MPYKLIFDDDSIAYLSHHGVKGMHWGVWNAETKMKYGDDKTPQQGGGGLSDEEVEELEEARNRREEDADSLRDAKYLRGSGSDQDYDTDRRGNTLSYRYGGGDSRNSVLARQKKGQKTWEHLSALGVTSQYVSGVSKVINKKKK